MAEKSLTQAQIDAMFGGSSESSSPSADVQDFDFGSQRSLSPEQSQEINDLSERFARSLAASLGAWLKADVSVGLVAVERTSYLELLEGVTERGTYFSSVQFEAVSAMSLLQLDLQLGYCVLDLLLGGTGKPSMNKELTHVDEQLFQAVMGFICDELSSSWQTVGMAARCRDRLMYTQINRLMPPDEQALCLTFEMKVAVTQGNLLLTLPAAVSSFLLRQLGGTWKGHREHPPAIRERLLQLSKEIRYPVTLQLPSAPIPLSTVQKLACGQVLSLNIPETTRPRILLAGQSLFEAMPVRKGALRAARLEAAVPPEA